MADGGFEEQAEFVLTYDGPALEQGRMSVRDLAPALLALGDLFQEANATASPLGPAVNLEVRATERASFDVTLHVILDDIVRTLTSPQATATANLIQIVSGASIGIFALIKRIGRRGVRGRVDDPAPPRPDLVELGGMTTLFLDDSTTLVFPTVVVDLYYRDSARRSAREVVAPLRRDGIEVMRLQAGDEVLEVRASDADAFDLTPGTLVNDTQFEAIVSIAAPSFVGHKWELELGDQTIWARIGDEQFLHGVNSAAEPFFAGDALQVILRMEQWREPDRPPRTEWTVLRVLKHEHLGAPTQTLFTDPDPAGETG